MFSIKQLTAITPQYTQIKQMQAVNVMLKLMLTVTQQECVYVLMELTNGMIHIFVMLDHVKTLLTINQMDHCGIRVIMAGPAKEKLSIYSYVAYHTNA